MGAKMVYENIKMGKKDTLDKEYWTIYDEKSKIL
jgi:hypothetical protein